jgi:hypothetical protein
MTRPNPSTQLTNPMPDATDEGLRVHCAVLERMCMALTLRDIRMRSVCELATGRPYDSFDASEMTYDELMEQVAQDMARGLDLSIQEARDRVARNKELSNPAQSKGQRRAG